MDTEILAGMYLWEARQVLIKEGINKYRIVVTAQPRLKDRTADDFDRVLMADLKTNPPQVLVCKT